MSALIVRIMAVFTLLVAGESALDGLGLTPAWHSAARYLLIVTSVLYLVRLFSRLGSPNTQRETPSTPPTAGSADGRQVRPAPGRPGPAEKE